MLKLTVILLFTILCIQVCEAQVTGNTLSDNKLKTRLDSLVERQATTFMHNGPRVGLSIGVIKDGHQYFYNYGSTEIGKVKLPTKNSVYELASITKTFASALLAKAVLEKRVSLDDDIRLYLDGQYPNLAYKNKPIKLINLANLTSGLPNWMPDKDLFSKANPDSIPYILDAVHQNYTRANLLNDLHQVRLDTIPGAVTRHCNTAAQLLGYIMERVYGAPMQTLVKIHSTKPLKMQNTSFLAKNKLPAKLVNGYDGKGRIMPFITWPDLQVAASLSSTTADMLQYMVYQMDENRPEVALSHQVTNGKPESGAIALNWKVNVAADTRKISHTGGSLGFSTYMVFYPDQKIGIILLANEAYQTAQSELVSLADKIISP